MDFDFGQIGTPFRMRPGLSRLPSDTRHLTPLRPGSALHAEKAALLQRWGSRCLSVPGFDASDVLHAVRRHAEACGVPAVDAMTLPPELLVEEDLAVLDTATARVPWMCVCIPTRWAPEDKIGLALPEVHQPVADSAALAAALPHVVRMLSQGGHWERFVWTLTAAPTYDQHPLRQPAMPWPETTDPQQLAQQCFLRVERQTFLPLADGPGPAGAHTLFTIRVQLAPLVQAVRSPEQAQRLHQALGSMTPAVLEYKNLGAVRERLLRWLAGRSGAPPLAPTALP